MKCNRARNSRTLFIMITASLVLWIPGILVKCTHFLCLKRVPLLLVHVLNFFHSATFLVNPIIYSLRIPMVRETFKREKLCMQSKKYSVNYTPWSLIEREAHWAPFLRALVIIRAAMGNQIYRQLIHIVGIHEDVRFWLLNHSKL